MQKMGAAMSAPLWMPLYIADYLADTGHLSTMEHGAYMLLIMHYWQTRGLPDDDAKLARIARMTPEEWATARATLADLFDANWTHARIDAELAKADETIGKRKAAGLAGASARYGKGTGNRIANAQQTHRQPQPPIPDAANAASSPARQIELDRLESELRDAAGLENNPSPGLLDLSPMLTLIDKGYDLARDILPKLREAKARGKSGNTWRYYVAGITEAKSANGTIAPKPTPTPGKSMVWVPEEDPRFDALRRRAEAATGKKISPAGSRHNAGIGWSFPAEMVEQVSH
jgi:uncharacterized protein YdaU (DUF1376 family)